MTKFKLILFDLDDTLYPRSSGVMHGISERITRYLIEHMHIPEAQAHATRRYFRDTYGTALRGLAEEGYPIDREHYLSFVHDIPLHALLAPDVQAKRMLLGFPLRRGILTNSNIEHAERVLKHLQIEDCFERVVDIRALNFMGKPDVTAYERTMTMFDVQPHEVIFVEDTTVNTKPAKALGMTTIVVDCPPSEDADYAVATLMDVGLIVENLIR